MPLRTVSRRAPRRFCERDLTRHQQHILSTHFESAKNMLALDPRLKELLTEQVRLVFANDSSPLRVREFLRVYDEHLAQKEKNLFLRRELKTMFDSLEEEDRDFYAEQLCEIPDNGCYTLEHDALVLLKKRVREFVRRAIEREDESEQTEQNMFKTAGDLYSLYAQKE